MLEGVTWPLAHNVIRRRMSNHTFGMVRKNADGTLRPHQGWDFEAAAGTPAHAVADGSIAFVRDRGDYGLQLCLAFKVGQDTRYAFYAHLQHAFVKAGDSVKMNDVLCKTGESGNAKGMALADQHLHFEVRTVEQPRLGLLDRVSPLSIFGKCPLTEAIAG